MATTLGIFSSGSEEVLPPYYHQQEEMLDNLLAITKRLTSQLEIANEGIERY